MHPREELKQLAKAIDVIIKVQEMPEVKASELVTDTCRELERKWFRRQKELREKFSRKKGRS